MSSEKNQAPEKLDELTSEDKLRIVRDELHFTPWGKGEVTEILGLLNDLGTPFSTRRHLNEILIHQQNAAIIDPKDTLLRMVYNYDTWQSSSADSIRDFEQLGRRLSRDILPTVSLKNELINYESALINLGSFSLRSQMKELEPVDQQDALAIANDMTIVEARGVIVEGLEDAKSRREFWGARLLDSQAHLATQEYFRERISGRIALGSVRATY